MNIQVPSKSQIKESIVEIFEKAKMLDRIILWRAVIPIDPALDKFAEEEGKRAISYVPIYEWQELKLFVWSFGGILKDIKDDDIQTRIMMTVYCHIFEADLPFAVIWNILRALKGLNESWIFTKENRKGDLAVCEYPSQKIQEIQNLSNEQNLKMGDTLYSLWNSKLRNSFSHSQYSIMGDGILFTKNISPISRNHLEGMPHGHGGLKKQDLEKYYMGACYLIDVFDQEYKYIRNYATN